LWFEPAAVTTWILVALFAVHSAAGSKPEMEGNCEAAAATADAGNSDVVVAVSQPALVAASRLASLLETPPNGAPSTRRALTSGPAPQGCSSP